MKPKKILKPTTAHDERTNEEIPPHTIKIKLRRRQCLSNLIATNQAILRSNNINTLHLF